MAIQYNKKNLRSLIMESKPLHPLHQIVETPSHKLLLKQWLKEEELILSRITLKATQIDSARNEITQATSERKNPGSHHSVFLFVSLGIISAIRYKTSVESHLEKLLEREKGDGQLLAKCVEELKKKVVEFDLLKKVDALRRAKSLRVELKAV
ncbi:Hypothetical predicted protein [Olea europaea subsp. europaea]|uniref:Uncharacterized protein n=1 Tax=Olea europaea subsp. europaea TaxID=158383 RepID=A0A8S0Q1L8_OLEEU|nr:Hypothetical predicted protein [Olea europaea subsp. europaea]